MGFSDSIDRAIRNIADHGDTDVFPFPIENRVIFDEKDKIVELVLEQNQDFDKWISSYPPSNSGALAPVGYTGFRWATQIDPLWNVHFLALVIEIAGKIEGARLPLDARSVFSYRFNPDSSSSDLFDRAYGWRAFLERGVELSAQYPYVISCDISEFYPRLNHHRLDNALRQLDGADSCRIKIMSFLSNFSETYSFGLPVGGPAARILSEITLNQIDRLLFQKRIPFCRFADDFFLFSESNSQAFKNLVYLSQILHRNQGLQLQKSKTRIMSSSEFQATNPLSGEAASVEGDSLSTARRSVLSLSLHFDPYSANAQEEYERLREEIRHFPILDMIRAELNKSRVDISLARKLIRTLRYVSDREVNDAAVTLIENQSLLYPIYYNVCHAVAGIWDRLDVISRRKITLHVVGLIEQDDPSVAVDINLQYAIRLLSKEQSEESSAALTAIYDGTSSPPIRSDIMIIMTKWRNWTWLSDKRAAFRAMTLPERRAFIMASYTLKDEESTGDSIRPMSSAHSKSSSVTGWLLV